MADVVLEDRSGKIEVRIFPELYQRLEGVLVSDAILVCKGDVAFSDFAGGMQMTATDVRDITKARASIAKGLKLQLMGCDLKEDFTSELADLLTPYKGRFGEGCPVSIVYLHESAKAEVTLGDAWRVSPADDLIQNLRDHYGNERVVLDY
jgi:DNA polymerase-3 subunit alpha